LLWIQGEKVGLGPLDRNLVEHYWKWEQEPRVVIGEGRQIPESLQARVEGFDHQIHSTNSARFTVYDLTANDSPNAVGTTALRIDRQVRTAEFIIKLGRGGQGRRLSSEATRLTLDYGFHVSNLRSIWLKVLERNVRGVQAYQAAGFTEAGRLRRFGFWLGEDCDEILMDILPSEFRGASVVRRLVEEN
jgi:RimJ/RimL family protein N-acetyltransferase